MGATAPIPPIGLLAYVPAQMESNHLTCEGERQASKVAW